MGGGPRGRNVISTEGNARALHFSPAPTGLRSGQFSRHSSDVCRACFKFKIQKSSASNTRNKACHKAPAKVITMNVSGGNSKEIFELFNNKLVFSVSVSQR